MIVYLARHGETFANRENVVLGRGDSPLTPSGIESLEGLAARLSGQQLRRVLASPLGRASASARLIAGRLGAEVIHCDALMELSCGDWEGKSRGRSCRPEAAFALPGAMPLPVGRAARRRRRG